MKQLLNSKMITFEEALQDPARKNMWEVIHFLQKHEDDILFPEKYIASQKDTIIRQMKALNQEAPNTSLKYAVFSSLEHLPDTVPASTLLELTRFAIEQWEALSVEAPAAHV
jgi:hypothetical protein